MDTKLCLRLLGPLEEKQKNFICRILTLHARSMLAPLGNINCPARISKTNSCADVSTGVLRLVDGWEAMLIGDLLHALQILSFPVQVQDPLTELCSEERIKELICEIRSSLEKDILRDINSHSGWNNRKCSPRVFALKFRHYLSAPSLKHRSALTQPAHGEPRACCRTIKMGSIRSWWQS
jgi:hypothetical protein